MHEFSIATEIVEAVLSFAEKNDVQRVLEIRLAVGELACIETGQLRFCFGAITPQTALENCALEIESVAAVVRCPHCAYCGQPKYWDEALAGAAFPTLRCPSCGRTAEAVEGRECAIRSVKFVGHPKEAEAILP
jgi:hydrogenase nickel incorporation protein HypA/HybF